MKVIFKIPYESFRNYFIDDEIPEIKSALQINSIYLWIRSWTKSFWKFATLMIVLVLGILFLFKTIGLVLATMIFKVIGWLIDKQIQFQSPSWAPNLPEMMWISSAIVISLFVAGIIHNKFRFDWAYMMRDLINDQKTLKRNTLVISKGGILKTILKYQPFPISTFCILAIAREKSDLKGYHNYIPGLSKAGSLSDKNKQLRDTKINGTNILTANDEFVDWRFVLVEYGSQLKPKEKKTIESLLGLLFDYYLRLEWNRIDKRKKIAQKKFEKKKSHN